MKGEAVREEERNTLHVVDPVDLARLVLEINLLKVTDFPVETEVQEGWEDTTYEDGVQRSRISKKILPVSFEKSYELLEAPDIPTTSKFVEISAKALEFLHIVLQFFLNSGSCIGVVVVDHDVKIKVQITKFRRLSQLNDQIRRILIPAYFAV